MMTADEVAVVKLVYARFWESESIVDKSEKTNWSEIDTMLEYFNWLTDEELVTESNYRFSIHKESKYFRCYEPHKLEDCFAPFILEAIGAVLTISNKSQELHPKNRYMLLYYMAMSELGMIFGTNEI